MLPLQLLAACAFLALSASTHSTLWALLGLALLLPILVDATAYLVGISRLGSPGELLQVLVHLPGYMLTWARSIWLALRSDEAWLSAQPIALRPPEPDRRHAPESS